MLTKEQKKRLAKEARKLSLQIAAKGPPGALDAGDWCGCGIGHVMQGAGFVPPRRTMWGPTPRIDKTAAKTMSYDEFCGIAKSVDELVDGLISNATAIEAEGTHGALVFPLLYLADVLEESARE